MHRNHLLPFWVCPSSRSSSIVQVCLSASEETQSCSCVYFLQAIVRKENSYVCACALLSHFSHLTVPRCLPHSRHVRFACQLWFLSSVVRLMWCDHWAFVVLSIVSCRGKCWKPPWSPPSPLVAGEELWGVFFMFSGRAHMQAKDGWVCRETGICLEANLFFFLCCMCLYGTRTDPDGAETGADGCHMPDTSKHPHPLLTAKNGTIHCPHCNSNTAAPTQPSP